MTKIPIGIFISDIHIKNNGSNHFLIKDIFRQVIELCQKHKIATIYSLGDIFDSKLSFRNVQTDISLLLFDEILNQLKSNDISLVSIVGNHDKDDDDGVLSFLHVFQKHSNFKLIETSQVIQVSKDVELYFLSYYKETCSKYIGYLNELWNKCNQSTVKCKFLLTHIAVNGVRNNDYTEVSNQISANLFASFNSVFVGHYHDKQFIEPNIHYMGSAYQANYGENDDKGVLILNEDGSLTEQNLIFPRYKTYEIGKNNVDLIESIIDDETVEYKNVKFTLSEQERAELDDVIQIVKQSCRVSFKKDDIVPSNNDSHLLRYNKDLISKQFDLFALKNQTSKEIVSLIKSFL